MTKTIALALTAALLVSAATPSFAQQTIDNCVFKDKSLCVTESLSPTTGDTEEPVQNVT